MDKLIIIISIILLIIFIYENLNNNINKNILPFGYEFVHNIVTSSKNDFFILLNKYGTKKDIDITNKILSINTKFAPTWGFKIDKNLNIEFEMYFYNYNPIHRMFENESITIDKLEKNLNGNYNIENKKKVLMYSIDYNEDYFIPNFYFFTSSDEILDFGYSIKNNKLNNYYYRYYPHTIDKKYKKYIDNKLINYDITNKKTIFVADKLIRNYYGIYYDGVKYNQVKYFINKYNYNIDIIKNLNKNSNYSISVDYNKNTDLVERIAIYGILN
jgi:hypothetical protein